MLTFNIFWECWFATFETLILCFCVDSCIITLSSLPFTKNHKQLCQATAEGERGLLTDWQTWERARYSLRKDANNVGTNWITAFKICQSSETCRPWWNSTLRLHGLLKFLLIFLISHWHCFLKGKTTVPLPNMGYCY